MAGTDIKNADNIDAVQFVIQSTHVAAAPAGHARLYRYTDGWYEADENGQSFIRIAQPSARVRRGGNQSIPNTTDTLIAFDTEDWDNNNLHDNSVNNTRLTIQTPGTYLLVAQVAWAGNANGTRATRLLLNGSTVIAQTDDLGSSDGNAQEASTIYQLLAGNYVEVQVAHSSGVSLSILGGRAYSPVLIAHRIG